MVMLYGRYDDRLCVVLLLALSLYTAAYWHLAIWLEFQTSPILPSVTSGLRSKRDESPKLPILVEPVGPLFKNASRRRNININEERDPTRVLVIASAPRAMKYIVSLWSSLECFTSDVEHVVISAPTWGLPIIERLIAEASIKIPRFASGEASLEGMVTINDRYDVGLWCDALEQIGIDSTESSSSSASSPDTSEPPLYDQIGLLNDSIYALREFSGTLSALGEHDASMSSLNYCLNDLDGEGPDHYWLESVWRGFDREGIQTFVDYSCRPVTDPLFCSNAWWGQKGCIVENFERSMARQFPRAKTVGLFASDVPKDMLTRSESFPTWVRHPSYWRKLVEEKDFPVSKVNWKGMIDSLDDERLHTCTRYLDRSWLMGFDFSTAKSTI